MMKNEIQHQIRGQFDHILGPELPHEMDEKIYEIENNVHNYENRSNVI